jgi:hypothetical protein
MNEPTPTLTCISCGVFRQELESLRKQGAVDFPVQYLDSMLHVHPCLLCDGLDLVLKEQLAGGANVLLLYGDCHAYMNDQESLPGVCRVRGRNCAEILLGPTLYRTLWKEQAFIFLPEWTPRWREVFHEELGLHGELTREFMTEYRSKLTYVDTGVTPVPTEHLEAASDAMGLPWEIVHVGTEHLLSAIREALERMSIHVG